MRGHLIYYYSLDGVAKRVFKLLMLSNITVFVKKLKSKIKAIAFLLMALKTPFLRYKFPTLLTECEKVFSPTAIFHSFVLQN